MSTREAAERVDRSPRTIQRWIQQGIIHPKLGRISEKQLLYVDRDMRQRKGGRPRKDTPRNQ